MSFDLEVLVMNQAHPVILPFQSLIEVMNEQNDENVTRFNDNWKVMSRTNGVWYSLVRDDDGVKNAYLLCDSDFEEGVERIPIPFWIQDEDVMYNLTPLIIRSEFKVDFEKILRFFLGQSPSNSIMFLARYQGGDCEIVQGVLTISEFMRQLVMKNILFNICYIIEE